MENEVEWKTIAMVHPQFVQWIVARFGPLPDGPVKEEDYNRYKEEYERG